MASRCVVLKNMYNVEELEEPDWKTDLTEEVGEECKTAYGGAFLHFELDSPQLDFTFSLASKQSSNHSTSSNKVNQDTRSNAMAALARSVCKTSRPNLPRSSCHAPLSTYILRPTQQPAAPEDNTTAPSFDSITKTHIILSEDAPPLFGGLLNPPAIRLVNQTGRSAGCSTIGTYGGDCLTAAHSALHDTWTRTQPPRSPFRGPLWRHAEPKSPTISEPICCREKLGAAFDSPGGGLGGEIGLCDLRVGATW
ncbi:uncharacterized protein BDZ99DRAFT_514534 [Mytilinidion resinicola]|uniref:Uncharacterized protein n=1 Tax=Mytilinidion resinicola TaxID=574789 RepID=A0A6A6Z4E2_9PEZI|nr:uncharacterized protein BDZ99DRAFT_514534 [Mytilinidion resinicola]KAF2815900.1 hypothetical protein BDZ99DRAFT_514534 [Mytilinidion resinicola]